MKDRTVIIDGETYRSEYSKNVAWTLYFDHEPLHERRYVLAKVGAIRQLFEDVPTVALLTGVSGGERRHRTAVIVRGIDAVDPADRERLETYRIETCRLGEHAVRDLLATPLDTTRPGCVVGTRLPDAIRGVRESGVGVARPAPRSRGRERGRTTMDTPGCLPSPVT